MVSRLLGLGAAVIMLATSTTASSGAAVAQSIWHVVPTASPQARQLTNSLLAGVSVIRPGDGWAVGQFSDSGAIFHPLTERWNGSRWSRVLAPRPSGRQAILNGVDELSATDAWAVGFSGQGGVGNLNVDDQPLAEHWDGTAWKIVHMPRLPSGSTGVLNAVGGTGPGDLWAVGAQVVAGSTIGLLLEHFNGTRWSPSAFPGEQSACDPGLTDCFLAAAAVSAASPHDVWVVGTVSQPNPTATLAAHWNGTAWQLVPTPVVAGGPDGLNFLTSVTDLGAGDAWASGYESNGTNVPYVLHWNGTAWSLTRTPNPGGEGSLLEAITALSPSDVWAVGQSRQLDGTIQTLTEHFEGTTWSVAASPDPGKDGNDSLDAVASPGRGLVFAAGAQEIKGQCCLRALGLLTASG